MKIVISEIGERCDYGNDEAYIADYHSGGRAAVSCAPSEAEIRAAVQSEIAKIEIPPGPMGPCGPQGERGEQSIPGVGGDDGFSQEWWHSALGTERGPSVL